MDPAEAPLPPDEVSFRELAAEALQDGRRVRLSLEITPFQERPSVEIKVLSPTGEMVATTSIVEIVEPKMSLTVHLRGSPSAGVYRILAELNYPDRDPVDQAETSFPLHAAGPNSPS